MAEQQFEFRVGKWLDTGVHPPKPLWGVEARPILAEGESYQKTALGMGWMPCMQDGKGLAFATPELAEEARAKLAGAGPLEEVEPHTVTVAIGSEVNQTEPSTNQAEYTLVYLFTRDGSQVLLIHKDHPHFMVNRWNGLGGKVSLEDASPIAAAVREVFEESAIADLKGPEEIMPLFKHQGNGYLMHVFCGFTDRVLTEARTTTQEKVQLFPIGELPWNLYDDVAHHVALALSKKPA